MEDINPLAPIVRAGSSDWVWPSTYFTTQATRLVASGAIAHDANPGPVDGHGANAARQSQILRPRPFFCQNGAKSGFEMCFGPSTLGAGAKTSLESRMKKFTPQCVCRPP